MPTAPQHSTRFIPGGSAIARDNSDPHAAVHVEAGIVLPDRADTHYRADLAVSRAPLVRGSRWVPDPVLVVEVLSPSTLAHDRGVKVPDYGTIPPLREILLLYTTERRADRWRRSGERWVVTTLVGDATLHLEAADATLSLAEIYEGAPA